MKIQTVRERLLASSMICGAALLALTATPVSAQEVEEIVVTGSRIPQPNLTSISPVQVVGSQEVLLGGRSQTIDILNQLPQVTQVSGVDLGPTSDALTTPGGVATVDLRGLGPQRTLVLVNSRRLGLGDPNTGNPNPAPDINQIPSQLIDHVEVLTGGASAVYGSDAVAGVVNFVMKKNFEGVQVDANFGVYQHNQHNDLAQSIARDFGTPVPDNAWDGKSQDFSVIFGLNAPDGRGNVTAYFTYANQEPVKQAARDFSLCQLDTTDGIASCSGSSNSNIFYAADGTGGTYAVLGNEFVDYGTPGTTPPPIFNANPYEYLLQQNTRYTAGFFANYEVNKNVELYSEFGFMHSRSNVNVGPSALFQGSGVTPSGGFLVNCNNPFLSAGQQAALQCSAADVASGASKDLYIGRRNIEGGPRNNYYNHTNYRIVGGARGEITGPWKYDIYGSYYYTSLDTRAENYLSLSRIQDALQVGGTAANPVCLSGNAGCVPYNIFQDGGVSPAAARSLLLLGTSSGQITERIIEATVTGDLGEYGIKSPWANDGIGVAFGLTQRRDHLEFAPDAAEESNDISGFGGAAVRIDNSLRAAEAYAEARIPLMQDKPFADELSVDAGYRYSDYSTGIQAKTWKIGAQWAPVHDIRFRGSYNKAIRAPSILELYTPQAVTNTSDVPEDPCAQNFSGVRPSLAACQNTGVTAAQYNGNLIPQCPANQCAVLNGGNTNLTPETAKTFTVGFTAQPRWVPGLTLGVDYYHVKLSDLIGAIPLAIILDRCLTTGDQTFCSQVIRNPANGTLFGTSAAAGGFINGTNVNVASGVNSGVDVQGSYALPLSDWGVDDWGKVSFDFVGSYLLKNTTVPLPGDKSYDCAGLFGEDCTSMFPKWRHTLRANWTMPWVDATLSVAWRYIGETKYEDDTAEPSIGKGTVDPFQHLQKAQNYFDVSALWHVNDMFSLRGGVNNVFDNDPPYIANAIVGGALPNAYPSYDLLGRRIFVGITANF